LMRSPHIWQREPRLWVAKTSGISEPAQKSSTRAAPKGAPKRSACPAIEIRGRH
jgi:hypothetical protein